MKKFTASIFLILQLVSLSGFILFQISIERSEISLDNKLDTKTYEDKYLVEIKIPLHLPYTTNGNFERIKGQIEHNGIWYSYVAKKVFQDTLHLLCISNIEKTKIINSSLKDSVPEESFFHNASRTPLAKKIKAIDQYSSYSVNYNFYHSGKCGQFSFRFLINSFSDVYFKINPPPPKFLC